MPSQLKILKGYVTEDEESITLDEPDTALLLNYKNQGASYYKPPAGQDPDCKEVAPPVIELARVVRE